MSDEYAFSDGYTFDEYSSYDLMDYVQPAQPSNKRRKNPCRSKTIKRRNPCGKKSVKRRRLSNKRGRSY